MLLQNAIFDVKFSIDARFLMKVFRSNILLNGAFHVGVRQRRKKLIQEKILNIYPHISFINNEKSVNCSDNACAMRLIQSILLSVTRYQ